MTASQHASPANDDSHLWAGAGPTGIRGAQRSAGVVAGDHRNAA
jgi:hypothetical protein